VKTRELVFERKLLMRVRNDSICTCEGVKSLERESS
jgi:hypothetical protein